MRSTGTSRVAPCATSIGADSVPTQDSVRPSRLQSQVASRCLACVVHQCVWFGVREWPIFLAAERYTLLQPPKPRGANIAGLAWSNPAETSGAHAENALSSEIDLPRSLAKTPLNTPPEARLRESSREKHHWWACLGQTLTPQVPTCLQAMEKKIRRHRQRYDLVTSNLDNQEKPCTKLMASPSRV